MLDQFQDDGEPYTSDPDKGIKNNWWNCLWIPFTSNGCGDHICIDLDPAEDGNFGQILQMTHDSGYRQLYSNSFTKWISGYINMLESEQLVYAKEWGIVEKNSPFNEIETT